MGCSSQSINRLEQTVEKLGEQTMQQKLLDRPILDRPALETKAHLSKAHNFIKYGEKSLSSHDGTGSLILRRPEISEIITKPT